MKSFRKLLTVVSIILSLLTIVGLSACGTSATPTNDQLSQEPKPPKPPKRTIQEAAFMGDIKLLQEHIAVGTDLNQKDEFGSTPLIIATTFGKTVAAIQLIEAGADVNVTGGDGGTALHAASFYCRTEIVEALLDRGVDLDIRNQYGATALEGVQASFEDVQPIYIQISKDLGPLGFKLDFDYIEATRPVVASMIRKAQATNTSAHAK